MSVTIFNILTIGPVGIGIGGKMLKNNCLTLKNPRKFYLIFFRIEILLHLGVPDNQILLHFSVPDNQILLRFGVPDNQILLHFGVPDNQILLHFGVPDNQILLHLDVPDNCSGLLLRGEAKQEPGKRFHSSN